VKIVVIGGGAAGLAIGWRLSQAGASVTVLERAQPGRAATWAAAGMIAVAGEVGVGNTAEAQFSSHSSALWPEFAKELEAVSGTHIGYARSGALMVQLAGEDARWLPSSDLVERVALDRAHEMEPALTRDLETVLWAPQEAQVDNRALGIALARAFMAAGGELKLNETAVRFDTRSGKAASVQTPFGRYDADAFLIAAGAWSGLIEGLPEDARPPVKPIKGEMIAVAGTSLPSHVIRGAHTYLVPRDDRLLIGATVEDIGFETHLTTEARQSLFDDACALAPGISRADIVEHWAGLRPGTPDDLPILGATTISGLFTATGQFRNGILFTPAIAELMCAVLLGRAEVPSAFDARRFCNQGSRNDGSI